MKIKQLKKLLNEFDENMEIFTINTDDSKESVINFLGLYEHEPTQTHKNGYIVLVSESNFINIDDDVKLPNKNAIYNHYDNFYMFTDNLKLERFKFTKKGKIKFED